MSVPQSREECLEWDRRDPLAQRRDLFRLPPGVIYLDGNSLGALTTTAERRVTQVLNAEWGNDLIRSWTDNSWLDYPARLGDRLGRLLGVANGSTLVCDSTSVDLFKLVAAASLQRGTRRKIVTEAGNFPTDLHILQGLARLLPDLEVKAVAREKVAATIDAETFLVVLTHVHYRTAEMYDCAVMTARAHEMGARILWDLSHSIGAVPLDLVAANADFAVGCTYKYLNGGPGAPGFLYVRKDLQDSLQPVLSGWLGDAKPFAFLDNYTPAAGIDRHRCGTPPVLAFAALEGALEAFNDIDMMQLRDKSVNLAELFIRQVEALPGSDALVLASPRDARLRGSHISFAHGSAADLMQRLIARGVIGDFRAPDLLRFGFTPLYLRFVDIWDAVVILGEELKK
jgi:kynureninase